MAELGSGDDSGNKQLGRGRSEMEKDIPAHLYTKAHSTVWLLLNWELDW